VLGFSRELEKAQLAESICFSLFGNVYMKRELAQMRQLIAALLSTDVAALTSRGDRPSTAYDFWFSPTSANAAGSGTASTINDQWADPPLLPELATLAQSLSNTAPASSPPASAAAAAAAAAATNNNNNPLLLTGGRSCTSLWNGSWSMGKGRPLRTMILEITFRRLGLQAVQAALADPMRTLLMDRNAQLDPNPSRVVAELFQELDDGISSTSGGSDGKSGGMTPRVGGAAGLPPPRPSHRFGRGGGDKDKKDAAAKAAAAAAAEADASAGAGPVPSTSPTPGVGGGHRMRFKAAFVGLFKKPTPLPPPASSLTATLVATSTTTKGPSTPVPGSEEDAFLAQLAAGASAKPVAATTTLPPSSISVATAAATTTTPAVATTAPTTSAIPSPLTVPATPTASSPTTALSPSATSITVVTTPTGAASPSSTPMQTAEEKQAISKAKHAIRVTQVSVLVYRSNVFVVRLNFTVMVCDWWHRTYCYKLVIYSWIA
jgi:hypothetical protein